MLIEEFDQALKDARPASKPAPEMLYHYTTAGGFEGIVKSRAFRATNFSFMNDPSEITYGKRLIVDRLGAKTAATLDSAAKRLFQAVIVDLWQEVSEIYVACFSSLADDLSQWRAYGGSPARYALGFRTAMIHQATLRPHPHFVKLSRVLYDRDEQEKKIDLVLDAAADFVREHDAGGELLALAAPLLSRLLRMLPTLKEPAYQAETEWRVVIRIRPGVPVKIDFDTSRGVIRPYLMFALEERTGVPMPLDSLHVLAPARLDPAIKAAAMVLDAAGVERVVPVRSGIPFAD